MNALRIVAAFKTEAVPIIERYQLKRGERDTEFPIFTNGLHALVLSGPGASAAAAATGCLYKACGNRQNAVWLNVGIAGHPQLPVGTVAVAGRISDTTGANRWTTVRKFTSPLPVEDLITVDAPETRYPEKALYDMEAGGFYATALQFTANDRVQCVKVISDNNESPLHTFSTRRAGELMRRAQPAISDFIDALLKQEKE